MRQGTTSVVPQTLTAFSKTTAQVQTRRNASGHDFSRAANLTDDAGL
jgi:hypothetical protein